MSNTLKFGNGEWYGKEGTILAYNDENNNYKPLPFTFERGSVATRVNKQGLIETVGADQPRIDYLNDSNGALLLEPSRTNVILQSQNITTGWSQGNAPTLTSNIAVAPDGTMTADGIQSETDGAFRTIRQLSISVSANSTVSNSYFVKKETSEINYGGFGLVFTGGTTKVIYGIVDSVNGTVTISDSNLTAINKIEDYGNYWKISTTSTDTGSNTSLGVYYYGTLSINGTSINTGVGSVRTIWGMQLELNSSYPTSYIPTQGSAVTRLQDVCNQTVPDGVIGQTEGSIFIELDVNSRVLSSSWAFSLNDGTTSNYIGLRRSGGAEFFVHINVSGTTTALISTGITNGKNKISIGYASNDIIVYVNGVNVGADTSSNIPTTSDLQIGNLISNRTLEDAVYGFKLYNTRLSNSELAALTQV